MTSFLNNNGNEYWSWNMLQGTFTHQVSWNIVASNKGRRMQKKTWKNLFG